MMNDGHKDNSVGERKLIWDEENRALSVDDNGFVSNYWYDADGERTVKTLGESDLMKTLLYILILFFLCESCDCQRKSTDDTIKFLNDGMVTEDSQQISDSFISNIEEIREELVSNEKLGINFMGMVDPANIFLPYAIRFNTKLDKYQASPIPTYKQISVGVDTIVYSKDSLLCVALLVIKNHFSDIDSFEKKREDGNYYDGRAVIGCRDTATTPFRIYPFTMFAIVAYNNIDKVSEDLKRFYFNDIVGKITPKGTNLEGDIYTLSLRDSDFFTKSPNFKLNEFGDYKFKYYLRGNKEIPYYSRKKL